MIIRELMLQKVRITQQKANHQLSPTRTSDQIDSVHNKTGKERHLGAEIRIRFFRV